MRPLKIIIKIGPNGSCSTIGGGLLNRVESNADSGTIGGGRENTVAGKGATFPGGQKNKALGKHSFAAGNMAEANHDGAFVLTDNLGQGFQSSQANEFTARFTVDADGVALAAIQGLSQRLEEQNRLFRAELKAKDDRLRALGQTVAELERRVEALAVKGGNP